MAGYALSFGAHRAWSTSCQCPQNAPGEGCARCCTQFSTSLTLNPLWPNMIECLKHQRQTAERLGCRAVWAAGIHRLLQADLVQSSEERRKQEISRRTDVWHCALDVLTA